MDFGLGAFLEKFEQHFGPRWTKALLVIVGLAIFATAVSGIWTLLLKPLLVAFDVLPSKVTTAQIPSIIFITLQIIAGCAFISIILDAKRNRIARDQIEELLSLSNEKADKVERLYDRTLSLRDELLNSNRDNKDLIELSLQLNEKMVTHALQYGAITQEQADELRTLRDTVLEIQP